MFSASLPPYLASAAVKAFDILEENPGLITKLRKNINTLFKGIFALHQVSSLPLLLEVFKLMSRVVKRY